MLKKGEPRQKGIINDAIVPMFCWVCTLCLSTLVHDEYLLLKKSIVCFYERQNSGSTSAPVVAHTTTEIDNDTEQPIPVEYGHWKALIFRGTGLVKIMKIDGLEVSPKTPSKIEKTINDFEKTWNAIKQDLVNEIYSSEKTVVFLPVAKIQFQYKMVHKLRGVGSIVMPVEKLSLWVLVSWLLRELSEVIPDPSISAADASLFEMKQETKLDNEKNFEKAPSLEELVEKAKALDHNGIEAVNTARKYFNADKFRQIDVSRGARGSRKSRNFDDTIDQQGRKGKEELQESVGYDLDEHFDEFKIFLRTKIDEGARRKPDENFDSQSSTGVGTDEDRPVTVEYSDLKAEIFVDRGIVRIEKTGAVPLPPINLAETRDGFEKSWYDLRQYILSLIYSQPQIRVEISSKHLLSQYARVRVLRGYDGKGLDTLANIVEWYLKELSETRPDFTIITAFLAYLSKRELTPENLAPLDFIVKVAEYPYPETPQGKGNSFEEVPSAVRSTVSELGKSQAEKKLPKISDDVELLVLTNIEESTKSLSSDEIRKTERIDDAIVNFESTGERENPSMKDVESSTVGEVLKPQMVGKSGTTNFIHQGDNDEKKRNIDRVKTEAVSNDEAHKFLIQIKNADEYKRDEARYGSSTIRDPLEEFKKPVWAPEEGKDSLKPFIRFQGKSDLPNARYDGANDRNFEYPSEYSMGTQSRETKSRHTGRRIEDDL